MASLRAFSCYRKLKRAYTRKSKYKKKSFIRTVPNIKIAKFVYGNLKKEFPVEIDLVSKEAIQIRHNALESARQVIIRKLAKMGSPYRFVIRAYPHHVLRENKMIATAGADRLQTGMQKAFGKPVGCAARMKNGQAIFTCHIDKANVPKVKVAMKAAFYKLPCKCGIVEREK